jgi:molybdopterin synthase sulfur carrier subunit
MPNIKIPVPLRSYTQGKGEILVDGQNVAEAMQSLVVQYPDLRQHLFNTTGELRPFINLFLNGDNLCWESQHRQSQLQKNQQILLHGLETPLDENDQLLVVLSIAGG